MPNKAKKIAEELFQELYRLLKFVPDNLPGINFKTGETFDPKKRAIDTLKRYSSYFGVKFLDKETK